MHIWLLEDDFRIAAIHATYVTNYMPHAQIERFLTGASLKQALTQATTLPTILLMDLYIPDVVEHELIAYVRHTYPSIYVIVVSAATEQHHVASLLSYGVFDYIVKPFEEERLHQALRHVEHVQKQLQCAQFTQAQIDALFQRSVPSSTINALPKGIDLHTLSRVEQLFEQRNASYTATELSTLIGTSRSTARRYLEHLVERNVLQTELSYGSVGRPERHYVRRGTYEQN